MKSKKIIQLVLVGVSMLTLSSFQVSTKTTLANQAEKIITAVFDGAEDYGYNFVYTNNDGEERTITFQNVAESVLNAFNLKTDTLAGTAFKVTYTTVIETEEDEEGFESETEVLTITKLETIKK